MARVGRMVKESSVEEFSTKLSERTNFFVMTLNRLPAPQADTLRQKLYASQAHLVMIKRRLSQRAVERLQIPGLAELLEGSVGFVLAGDDVLQTAKLLIEFHKAHEEQLSVRGAVIDGQLLDTGWVEQLAQLPPKPLLLAEVVGTLESPMADVIFTIERLIGDLAWLAEQIAEKKPKSDEGAEAGGAASSTVPATPAPSAPSASADQKPPQQVEEPGAPEKA
jgi:large subunit ribosomal protein L10